jgi:hypothetical protein
MPAGFGETFRIRRDGSTEVGELDSGIEVGSSAPGGDLRVNAGIASGGLRTQSAESDIAAVPPSLHTDSSPRGRTESKDP